MDSCRKGRKKERKKKSEEGRKKEGAGHIALVCIAVGGHCQPISLLSGRSAIAAMLLHFRCLSALLPSPSGFFAVDLQG